MDDFFEILRFLNESTDSIGIDQQIEFLKRAAIVGFRLNVLMNLAILILIGIIAFQILRQVNRNAKGIKRLEERDKNDDFTNVS